MNDDRQARAPTPMQNKSFGYDDVMSALGLLNTDDHGFPHAGVRPLDRLGRWYGARRAGEQPGRASVPRLRQGVWRPTASGAT